MKPLIRQTLYDILRKDLYNHEIKEKVWNNPYFPFLTSEAYESEINALSVGSELSKSEIREIFISYQKEIKNNNILSFLSYNSWIDNIIERQYSDKISLKLIFKYSCSIWRGIENRYGDKSICSSNISNKKWFFE